MLLRPEQLASKLEQGLSPFYLFGGPESLLLQECRDQVFEAARKQGFLERELFEVDRYFDWESLAQAGAPSLFASRKIVDLRLPTGKPGREGAAALAEWAAAPDADRLLVVSCETWDKSSRDSKWAAGFANKGTRVDIWPVTPADLPAWITRRMKALGLEPDRGAVMVLADRLEGNLLAAQQEIEKLALLKGKGKVGEEDVLQAVADSSRFDAFLLAERILEGNLADGLRVASGLHRTGIPIQLVTGALYREFRVLESFRQELQSGQNEMTAFRQLNIWRNRQKPMSAAARRVGSRRLLNAFSRLSLIDLQSKGRAPGDPWQELDQLVCSLCGG